MLDQYQIALLIGATFTTMVSWHLPRARWWTLAGFLSFFLSTAYARYGLPHSPAFTLACDAAVCLFVYSLANEEWHLRIFDIFRLSVLITLLHMFGIIGTHYLWVVSLELLNWLAMLLIVGTGIATGMADGNSPIGSWIGNLRRLGVSLRTPRKAPRWFDIPR